MKKKNQELEKFKFVLDYKIKELRKQMEPRENEIKRMKEQIQKVGIMITDLLLKYMYTCYSIIPSLPPTYTMPTLLTDGRRAGNVQ